MPKNNGQDSAFGYSSFHNDAGLHSPGLTKREYMATMILQGLLANGKGPAELWISDDLSPMPVVKKALDITDDLLKQLE